MKLPRRLIIGDNVWSVSVTDLPSDLAGDCRFPTSEIRINKNCSDYEQLVTLVHEAIHAIEFTKGIKIGHPIIEKIEAPIASVFSQLFWFSGYSNKDGPERLARRSIKRVRPNTPGPRKARR